MDRVFLDANVLFSAAYRPDSGVRRLWGLSGLTLITSTYAAEEARRNLDRPEQAQALEQLLAAVELVPEPDPDLAPESAGLPEKDRPILAAAIAVGATHLLTGDLRHFQHLLGRRIAGVRVLRPAEYLRREPPG